MSQTELKPVNNRSGDRSKAQQRKLPSDLPQIAGILPILVLSCILFTFLMPNFLTVGNIVNLRQASINIVLATGMTFVILTGGIDLSVGSICGSILCLSRTKPSFNHY